MFFTANSALEQEVFMAAIMIALFIFARFQSTPTHVQSEPMKQEATLRQDIGFRSEVA